MAKIARRCTRADAIITTILPSGAETAQDTICGACDGAQYMTPLWRKREAECAADCRADAV